MDGPYDTRKLTLSARSRKRKLHIEVPGATINVELFGDGMTYVSVSADGDRYAGESLWWADWGKVDASGGAVRIMRQDPCICGAYDHADGSCLR